MHRIVKLILHRLNTLCDYVEIIFYLTDKIQLIVLDIIPRDRLN
jgi:hypothetical protein